MEKSFQDDLLLIDPLSDSMNIIAYCVLALDNSSRLTRNEANRLVAEIGALKRNGHETFSKEKMYHLSSTGTGYWGLQLLCMEYVFARMIGIEMEVDSGISGEYKTALWLYKNIYKAEHPHFIND
jgi:hypothetical protein